MVFHRNLSDSKSPHVSSTILSIVANFNITVIIIIIIIITFIITKAYN